MIVSSSLFNNLKHTCGLVSIFLVEVAIDLPIESYTYAVMRVENKRILLFLNVSKKKTLFPVRFNKNGASPLVALAYSKIYSYPDGPALRATVLLRLYINFFLFVSLSGNYFALFFFSDFFISTDKPGETYYPRSCRRLFPNERNTNNGNWFSTQKNQQIRTQLSI